MRAVRNVAAAVSALALVGAPISAAAAARPSSAVPTAAASSVSASQGYGAASAMTPWPAYAIIALTFALGIWIVTKGDKDGDGFDIPVSRG